jgi:hypothetical protein
MKKSLALIVWCIDYQLRCTHRSRAEYSNSQSILTVNLCLTITSIYQSNVTLSSGGVKFISLRQNLELTYIQVNSVYYNISMLYTETGEKVTAVKAAAAAVSDTPPTRMIVFQPSWGGRRCTTSRRSTDVKTWKSCRGDSPRVPLGTTLVCALGHS